MNSVFFPGLGLELNVPQIALRIGNIGIYYYSICICSGIGLSLILGAFSKEKFDVKFEDFLEVFIISLIIGLVGARAYFCIFNFKDYVGDLTKIFAIRDGGLAIYGGILAGLLTAFIVTKIRKMNFKNMLDFVAPYLALTQGIGRFGNFFNVECFGSETTSLLRMGIFKEGNYIEVHPCFLYEAISCFTIFIILRIMQKNRKFESQIFASYMVLYGIARFFIESLRSDSLYFLGLKVSQLVSLAFVVIGGLIIFTKVKKSRKM